MAAKLHARNRSQALELHSKMHRDEERLNERIMERLRNVDYSYYAGTDYRRRQEIADGGMIQEDPGAMANLPTQARHHEYPKAGYYNFGNNCLFGSTEEE